MDPINSNLLNIFLVRKSYGLYPQSLSEKPVRFFPLNSRQIATFANWLTRKGKRQLFLPKSHLYFSMR